MLIIQAKDEANRENVPAAERLLLDVWSRVAGEEAAALRPVDNTVLVDVTKRLASREDRRFADQLDAIRSSIDIDALTAVRNWRQARVWVWLSGILGDDEAAVGWYKAVGHRYGREHMFAFSDPILEEILVRYREWEALGWLRRNPANSVARHHGLLRSMQFSGRESEKQILNSHFLASSAQCYAACVAAGRVQEANGIAEQIRMDTVYNQALLIMLDACLETGAALPVHLEWLDELEARRVAIGDRRKRLESILGLKDEGD